MSTHPPNYFMDDPREARRLADKVDAAQWVARYLRDRLPPGAVVLDVGCGPGVIAAEVARQISGSRVTGLDASAARIEEARRNLSAFAGSKAQVGDAAALPFADGSFDAVYSRMLLEYLPDKQQAVAEMVRGCRPGGLVLLQDLDGQLVWHHPPDAALEADVQRVLAALATTGFDPFVGRKLFALARGAGLRDLAVSAESYHLFAGRIDAENLRLWELKLDIALPAAAQALGGAEAAQSLKERFLDYLQREDTLTYSVLFTVVGRKA
jgi:SAM-dependent methyltransferase